MNSYDCAYIELYLHELELTFYMFFSNSLELNIITKSETFRKFHFRFEERQKSRLLIGRR